MVDPIRRARLVHGALFVALAAMVLFLRMLPLTAVPARWPGPDLILCLALVWVLRRPDYVPALLIALVLLVEDLLTMRPPGLWPLIVLGATEFLRSREAVLRDLPFLLEWLMAGALILAMMLVNHAVLALFVVPQGGVGPEMIRALVTMTAYPLVVLASLRGFGLRKVAPGEVDALGHRL